VSEIKSRNFMPASDPAPSIGHSPNLSLTALEKKLESRDHRSASSSLYKVTGSSDLTQEALVIF
jgi:hypothetical protein